MSLAADRSKTRGERTSILSREEYKGLFTGMLKWTTAELANSQAEYAALGTGVAEATQRALLTVEIASEKSGIAQLQSFISKLDNQLKNLNGLKDSINKSFDNMINNIKSMTYTYPNGDTYTIYGADSQPIDYTWV